MTKQEYESVANVVRSYEQYLEKYLPASKGRSSSTADIGPGRIGVELAVRAVKEITGNLQQVQKRKGSKSE